MGASSCTPIFTTGLIISSIISSFDGRSSSEYCSKILTAIYDLWGIRIFSNIAQSEQQHMNAVLTLIEKYDLNDPIKVNERGVYTDENLQALYNQLIEQGSKSLEDALIVGATIEDLDIYDLEEFLKITDNQDIEFVYEN